MWTSHVETPNFFRSKIRLQLPAAGKEMRSDSLSTHLEALSSPRDHEGVTDPFSLHAHRKRKSPLSENTYPTRQEARDRPSDRYLVIVSVTIRCVTPPPFIASVERLGFLLCCPARLPSWNSLLLLPSPFASSYSCVSFLVGQQNYYVTPGVDLDKPIISVSPHSSSKGGFVVSPSVRSINPPDTLPDNMEGFASLSLSPSPQLNPIRSTVPSWAIAGACACGRCAGSISIGKMNFINATSGWIRTSCPAPSMSPGGPQQARTSGKGSWEKFVESLDLAGDPYETVRGLRY